MTPDKDGWIKHDGGNNPVTPECWVQLQNETQAPMRADDATWSVISRYRIYAVVTPGPSPFVAETAARIMAQKLPTQSFAPPPSTGKPSMTNPIDTARDAPERIWATEDRKNFGEDRFHATTPMRGLTEYLRADRAASQADTARQEGVSLGLAMARAIADEIRAISDAAAGKTSTGPHSYGAGYDAGERAVIHHFAVELEDKSPIPPHIVAARVLLDEFDRIDAGNTAVDWSAVWKSMGDDMKECGWNDWPSIFFAALEQIAKEGE